jgi:hypothetical protein
MGLFLIFCRAVLEARATRQRKERALAAERQSISEAGSRRQQVAMPGKALPGKRLVD